MRKIFFSLIVLSLLAGCTVISPQPRPTPSTTGGEQESMIKISQAIALPDREPTKQEVEAKPTESALDVLKRTHTVAIKSYSFGDIADGIDGVMGGKDGRYWIFYLNGEMSSVGAGEYKVKAGDQILWKYQKESEGL